MTTFVLMLLALAVLAVLVGAAAFSWLLVRFAASLPVRADEILYRIDVVRNVDLVRDRVDELRVDVDAVVVEVDEHHDERRSHYEGETAAYQHLIDQVYAAEERVKALEGRLQGTIGKIAATGIVDLSEETR